MHFLFMPIQVLIKNKCKKSGYCWKNELIYNYFLQKHSYFSKIYSKNND